MRARLGCLLLSGDGSYGHPPPSLLHHLEPLPPCLSCHYFFKSSAFALFFTSSMHYNFDSMPNRLHDAICFKMRSKSIFQLNCYGPIGLPDTSWRDDLIRPGAVFSISYFGPTSYPDQWSTANTGSSAILLKNGVSKAGAWKDSIVGLVKVLWVCNTRRSRLRVATHSRYSTSRIACRDHLGWWLWRLVGCLSCCISIPLWTNTIIPAIVIHPHLVIIIVHYQSVCL